MSKSYTPGLKVLKNTSVKKDRLLPLKGNIHVNVNDIVESDTVVASTEIPGNVQMINVANELNIDANEVENCMKIKINENVSRNQVIAESKGLFGYFKSEIKSPIDGMVINISNITGQIVISEKPLPIKIDAYIPGKIMNLYEDEGVLIDSKGTFIQGIIGIGGEKQGEL